MEPEGSLWCLKESTASPLLSKMNPTHNIIPCFCEDHILILSLHVRLGVPSGLFPYGFRLEFHVRFL
jgi:hypothetical protein